MDDCLFCKIVKGEIPCAKVYEDDDIMAFLDIAPVNKGHTLVIPKKHYVDFLDMPDDIVQKLFTATKKITKAVVEGVKADGFNFGMNNKKAGGQLVMHAHLHIMPRFNDDGLKLWEGHPYNEGDMDKVKEDIVKALNP